MWSTLHNLPGFIISIFTSAIALDFGEQPGRAPSPQQKSENARAFISFYHIFPPRKKQFGFANPIF